MQMQTNRDTSWWEGRQKIDIGAGLVVEVLSDLAIAQLRKAGDLDRDCVDGIKGYRTQGREFVMVMLWGKQRIIDRTWLEKFNTPMPPQSQGIEQNKSQRVKSLYK
jgi:hypothetical protein